MHSVAILHLLSCVNNPDPWQDRHDLRHVTVFLICGLAPWLENHSWSWASPEVLFLTCERASPDYTQSPLLKSLELRVNCFLPPLCTMYYRYQGQVLVFTEPIVLSHCGPSKPTRGNEMLSWTSGLLLVAPCLFSRMPEPLLSTQGPF